MKAVRQSFQKQGLDSVILAEKGAMSLWGLPSEWRGTLEAPSTAPDWYRSSVLVPSKCQYFLPSETMCTLGTLEPGINLFPYPKHGDLHLKGCRMRLACTWGNITNRSCIWICLQNEVKLFWFLREDSGRMCVCKHQSLPSIFSKTKFLRIITWSFKHISHRNAVIKNNNKKQDMYLLI